MARANETTIATDRHPLMQPVIARLGRDADGQLVFAPLDDLRDSLKGVRDPEEVDRLIWDLVGFAYVLDTQFAGTAAARQLLTLGQVLAPALKVGLTQGANWSTVRRTLARGHGDPRGPLAGLEKSKSARVGVSLRKRR